MRLPRALSLALAAIIMFAAGVVPACVPGMCCPLTDAPAMHAQMPCCQGESSITPREPVGARPATFAGYSPLPQMWTPAVLIQLPIAPARVSATLAGGRAAQHEPSPPLFLLNAQFLI